MPANKAKKQQQNVTIAQLRATGKNCREIAKCVNLSHVQVSRRLKDSDVKDRIDGMLKYYVSYDKEVQAKFMSLVLSDIPDIRQKAITEYHKVMGITTPHPSISIERLYVDNRSINYQPHIQAMIDKEQGQVLEGEIIEDG